MNRQKLKDFVYDDFLGWFEGTVATVDGEVSLCLSAESEEDALSLLDSAEPFLKSLEKVISSAKDYAADKLLKIRNDGWREENSAEISSNDFILRLSCSSVTLYMNQSVEIVFRDGGLFFGHVVLISGNMQGHLSDAAIAG